MKAKKSHFPGYLLAALCFTGCDDRPPTEQAELPEEALAAADRSISTSNYLFLVFEEDRGELFSIYRSDHSLVASKITEEEFKTYFPEAFDEFALLGVSDDGFGGRIYYDDHNTRVLRFPE